MNVAFGIQGSGQHVDGAPDPGVFRELAQAAEALGYDSIWAGDHISYRNPILDVVVALSTFAAVTRADHARRRRGAVAATTSERGGEGVLVPRLRVGRTGDPWRWRRGRGGEGLRGGRRADARARRADERGDARAASAVLRQRHVLGSVLLLRGHRDRAAARASGRPPALGRRPVGGGYQARRDARRRLDPALGLARAACRRL